MSSEAVIVIVGMHRSGTSCLAGSLEEAGLHLGNVVTEAPYNRKGNRENLDIMRLHDDVLTASEGSWDHPPRAARWTDEHRSRRDRIIAGYPADARWGFKDPRTLVVLEGWTEVLPRIRFVGTFRHPLAVAASLMHRNGRTETEWVELWVDYNRRLLALHDAHGFPLACFDDDVETYRARLEAIARALDLPGTARMSFFEAELRSHRTYGRRPAPPEAEAIYAELRLRSTSRV